jgi:hypothetical protein
VNTQIDLPQKSLTFIVRVGIDPTGQATGVVERVSSGQKCRFHGFAEISPLIERMACDEDESKTNLSRGDGV